MQEPSLIALSGSDALAISMVALMSFALGMIVTILVMLARSGKHGRVEVAEEFEESDPESQSAEVRDSPSERRAPWERKPDWWRDP